MMRQAVLDFPKQFAFEPHIEDSRGSKHYERYIIAGMGGSALAGALLAGEYPDMPLTIHRNYGLPYVDDETLKKTLVVAVSYFGNTEETLDSFNSAMNQNIDVVAISTGGKLLELAREKNMPYIQLPNTNIPPRLALGFMTMALAAALRQHDAPKQLRHLASTLRAKEYEDEGKRLADMLLHKIPVIYASERNATLAYIWKITLNETGKIPAFYNVLPELNHNEMEGFSAAGESANQELANLLKRFSFILLQDAEDHLRIRRRMEVLTKMLRDRNLRVEEISLEGASRLFRVFASVVVATWAAYYLALAYHVDPETTPMIEELKKTI